jgi:hypothetical protein
MTAQAARHVPESREAAPAPMDWLGSLLAIVALAAVTCVLISVPEQRSAPAGFIAAIAIALGASAALVRHEKQATAPMLPAAVFRSVPFVAASFVTFFVYGALGAFSFAFTAALETIAGYSPVELLLSGPSGELSARISPRLQLMAGPVLCVAAGSSPSACPRTRATGRR